VEINKADLNRLENVVDVVYQNTQISAQLNDARKVVKADTVHEKGYFGRNISTAVLDTGVSLVKDLAHPQNRVIAFRDFINKKKEPYDDNGHGTHVSGIVAGSGANSDGKYMGIAPKSNIVSVKILDSEGKGNSTNALLGISWVIENAEKYNIRIINLSIGTKDKGIPDPLVKAVEKCWDSGIVVVIAAGNNGPQKGSVTSPGTSRKVITVGASDDKKTSSIWGDILEDYSGRGPTREWITKPDIIAPGSKIISCLSPNCNIVVNNSDNEIIDKYYISISGTSMATPIVSGAIALLLERYPYLYPDDVKLMIKKCAVDLKMPKDYQGWGLLDIDKLLTQEGRHVR